MSRVFGLFTCSGFGLKVFLVFGLSRVKWFACVWFGSFGGLGLLAVCFFLSFVEWYFVFLVERHWLKVSGGAWHRSDPTALEGAPFVGETFRYYFRYYLVGIAIGSSQKKLYTPQRCRTLCGLCIFT